LWLEDIHDPHNWLVPFTGSYGAFSAFQGLPDDLTKQFDAIQIQGVSETDPAKRNQIYQQANQLYYEQCIGLPIVLATSVVYRQRWVQGEILNPMFSGIHYYEIYKD
jgi:ABC-type transport system substrate-binding protein